MSPMWAVVPIKQFGLAKQRLADLLTEQERIELAEAMLRDVLGALGASTRVDGIVIVSKEPAARRVAEELGAQFLSEDDNDLSAAVAQGGAYVAAQGANAMLVVHGDVPLLCAAEVDRLIDAHDRSGGLTLASDRDGTGTNGLVVSPVDLITFAYGRNSYQAHAEAGRSAGVTVRTLDLDGLSLDIDNPDDIRCLMTDKRTSATSRYLNEINVVSRLPPRHNVEQAVVG